MTGDWQLSAWKRVVVYGLGVSGLAAMRFLRSRDVEVVAVDERRESEIQGDLGCATETMLGCEDPGLPAGVDAVVLSPGVPSERRLVREALAGGIPVLSEVELAFPFLGGPVVAITGSNGKSSTAAMTAAILTAAGLPVELCGNIGRPLCSTIEGDTGRVFVVELSSFQLEQVCVFAASSAALLNLSPDHLDRYPDYAAYVAAKRRIFERRTDRSTAVLNADDLEVRAIGETLTVGRRRYFSRSGEVDDGCYLVANGSAETVLEVGENAEGSLFAPADLRVAGLHNLENAMAAALLARSCGASAEEIRRGLASFRGLPHRLERVRRWRGVEWFDDSKGTNVGATRKSLEGFPDDSVHLILGGRNKGTDPGELRAAARRKVRRLYLIGESAPELEKALAGVADLDNVGTLERAVERASEMASSGEFVVLSPACASFDQFESFEHRGECFQALVRALNGGHSGEEARV